MATQSSKSGDQVMKNADSDSGKSSDSLFGSYTAEDVVNSPGGVDDRVSEGGFVVKEADEEWVPSGLDMVVFDEIPKAVETEEEEDPSEETSEFEPMGGPVIGEAEDVESRQSLRKQILKELDEMRSSSKKMTSARILKKQLAKKIPCDKPITVDSTDSENGEPPVEVGGVAEGTSTPLPEFCQGETSKGSLSPLLKELQELGKKKPIQDDSLDEDTEYQPLKKGKLSSKKTTSQKSSKKRSANVKIDLSAPTAKKLRTRTSTAPTVQATPKSKDVLEELGVSEQFLEDTHLQEVLDVLKFQDWLGHLSEEDEVVDKELVAEFFSEVYTEVKGPLLCLNFKFKGQELMVTCRDLAAELGFKNQGFDLYSKKQWPAGMSEAEIEQLQRAVCNVYEPNVTELSTNEMGITTNVLHRFLVHSFLPRKSKTSSAQIQDILVMNQILQGNKVNWPKLILHHMEYMSQFNEVGYAKIVKKILLLSGVYEPQLEVPVSKPLTVNSLHRWGFVFVEDAGWTKKENRVPVEEPRIAAASASELIGMKNSLARLEQLAEDQRKEIKELRELIQNEFTKMRKQMKALGGKQGSET